MTDRTNEDRRVTGYNLVISYARDTIDGFISAYDTDWATLAQDAISDILHFAVRDVEPEAEKTEIGELLYMAQINFEAERYGYDPDVDFTPPTR